MKSKYKIFSLVLSCTLILSQFSTMSLADDADDGMQVVSVEDVTASKPTETSSVAPVSSVASTSSVDTSNLEAKLNELKRQSDAIQQSINSIKSEKNDEAAVNAQIQSKITNVESQISIINTQISNLDKSVASLTAQITELTTSIAEKEVAIAEMQAQYDETFETFKKRLVELYISGESTTLEILLTSQDFSQLLSNSEYMKAIAAHDQETMDDLLAKKTTITSEKEEIETQKLTLEENKTQLETDKAAALLKKEDQQSLKTELATLKGESDAHLSEINAELKEQETEKKMTDAEAAKLEAEIQAIIAEHSDTTVEYSGGSMGWPVSGAYSISSPYMGYAGHTGMDITDGKGTTSGKAVLAANAGTVIMVVRGYTGYGHYVIIDHGGGITTLYAHMSSISVSSGQKVTRGQTIGAVGSTGNSTGPHLHFEVRINGKHTNPAGYVSAG